jgi:hypothetical protein
MNVCEQQLNKMKAKEPDSVELVCETHGQIVRTNKKNHYKIDGDNAIICGGFDECNAERDKECVKVDG